MKTVTIKELYQIVKKAGELPNLTPDIKTEAQFRKYVLSVQNDMNPLIKLGGKLRITVNKIKYKIKEVEQ